MAPRGQDDRDELSRALADARQSAGLSQTQAAQTADLSQNKISRIEHGKGLLKLDEAATLLSAYGVRGAERRRIMALIEDARTRHVDARVILQRGAHHFQERLRRLAEESQQVRSFSPTAVIGYVQTLDYMRVVFTQRMTVSEAAPSIEKRLAQQQLLEGPDRLWAMIHTEGALRWSIGGPTVMADQIDRITQEMGRANVTLGFIPWHRPVALLPMTGFHIYDRRAVVVGTWSGTAIIHGKQEVEEYEELFERISRVAMFDNDARVELERIAAEYRELT